jgi:hypothetical protein
LSTTRQNIISNIVAELQEISQLKSVTAEEVVITDLDTVPMPCAFVVVGPETRLDVGTIGYETWNWSINVEVWAKTDLEVLLGLIHTKMYEQPLRGGYALNTVRVGSDIFTIESDKQLNGLLINFQIHYRHSWGNP